MMPKGDTIAAIMRVNRSAHAEFLSQFSGDDLTVYLERLNVVQPSTPQKQAQSPTSPGAAALRSAARTTQKDAPFRFKPEPATP